MFLLVTTSPYSDVLGSYWLWCRTCNERTGHDLVEGGTRLKLFFVPVWTFGKHAMTVCRTCGRANPMSTSDVARVQTEEVFNTDLR